MQAPALVLLALGAGALLAAQGPILTRLATYAGGPIQAAIVAFAIGLIALLAASVLTGAGLPRAAGIARMPAWAWAGGLIGTGLLMLTLHAVPRIGVAAFAAAVVCGQLVAALAYDHVGAFGMEPRSIGLRDIAGVICLLVGLAMIAGEHRT
jgi:bacterial/archaeal transporter family-2 protein